MGESTAHGDKDEKEDKQEGRFEWCSIAGKEIKEVPEFGYPRSEAASLHPSHKFNMGDVRINDSPCSNPLDACKLSAGCSTLSGCSHVSAR